MNFYAIFLKKHSQPTPYLRPSNVKECSLMVERCILKAAVAGSSPVTLINILRPS